jgi:hypothetical protein
MKFIADYLKKSFPGVYKFLADFFEAMNNKQTGHSLRKWLAVGFYWIMCKISLEYTTSANVVMVLGVHGGMVTALIITYTVGNNAQQKIENNKSQEIPKTDEQS